MKETTNKFAKMNQKALNLKPEELAAIYKIIKDYQGNTPDNEEEFYNDYNDEHDEPIDKKILNSILKKISKQLPEYDKEEIDKDFLRKKYHSFNNYINEKAYSVLERAFEQLMTVEIEYFNMESTEFRKRRIDIYYKSRKYTIGYCHLRKDIRKFRTSRIASAKITDSHYKIPKSFDKNDY